MILECSGRTVARYILAKKLKTARKVRQRVMVERVEVERLKAALDAGEPLS